MSNYTINPNSRETQVVGKIPQKILDYLSIKCPDKEIKMYPGVIKHLSRSGHYNIFMEHYQSIPDMISQPDYVGQNPKEPNSVELYKRLSDTLLVAIKLDPSGYLYLSSFYDLHNADHKIQKRLRSGRIIAFSDIK
ncbi:plasmid-related protein [Alkalibacillus silvisoli]|uniref:PBECR2 nuclease fold domain-containing protein n=1 Tax=Alkalibacillus silvisoli TaxID=392823 RepID=A0ABN1AC20_9BACI